MTAIHNPDRSSPPAPKSSITVYVDVSCPNEPDDPGIIFGPVGPFAQTAPAFATVVVA